MADGECELNDGSSPGDWRLPNVREIHSLSDFGNRHPALPSGQPFTGVRLQSYWSSNTAVESADEAWIVTLNGGFVVRQLKSLVIYYVWPVRSANNLLYTPVTPCRIVDTRKTAAGIISASTHRDFHVHGSTATISDQGGNSAGCPTPLGEPLAVHINMVAANPTGKGNMQAFPVGGKPGANFGINFAKIGTNFVNAGTVQAATGSGPDITVTSRVSSSHAVIDVLGYYYNYPTP